MPGLVPGIHVLLFCGCKDVDGRDKPGHDEAGALRFVHSGTHFPRAKRDARTTA
jgi:hypothetical protein